MRWRILSVTVFTTMQMAAASGYPQTPTGPWGLSCYNEGKEANSTYHGLGNINGNGWWSGEEGNWTFHSKCCPQGSAPNRNQPICSKLINGYPTYYAPHHTEININDCIESKSGSVRLVNNEGNFQCAPPVNAPKGAWQNTCYNEGTEANTTYPVGQLMTPGKWLGNGWWSGNNKEGWTFYSKCCPDGYRPDLKNPTCRTISDPASYTSPMHTEIKVDQCKDATGAIHLASQDGSLACANYPNKPSGPWRERCYYSTIAANSSYVGGTVAGNGWWYHNSDNTWNFNSLCCPAGSTPQFEREPYGCKQNSDGVVVAGAPSNITIESCKTRRNGMYGLMTSDDGHLACNVYSWNARCTTLPILLEGSGTLCCTIQSNPPLIFKGSYFINWFQAGMFFGTMWSSTSAAELANLYAKDVTAHAETIPPLQLVEFSAYDNDDLATIEGFGVGVKFLDFFSILMGSELQGGFSRGKQCQL